MQQHHEKPLPLHHQHTHTLPKNLRPEQRREQHLSRMCSSSGFWCSGVGDPLGLHVLQVSVQAPAVLLQYPCVSPTAQKKTTGMHTHAGQTPTESVQSPRESLVAMTPAVSCKENTA